MSELEKAIREKAYSQFKSEVDKAFNGLYKLFNPGNGLISYDKYKTISEIVAAWKKDAEKYVGDRAVREFLQQFGALQVQFPDIIAAAREEGFEEGQQNHD